MAKGNSVPVTFRFGAAEVQAATHQLLIDGVPVALGARAFELLLALIDRRDRLVPKHELLEVVWRGQVVEESNLHVQVSTLRKLLGPSVITTVPGRGYRFVAAVHGLDGPGDVDQADAPQAGAPVPAGLPPREPASPEPPSTAPTSPGLTWPLPGNLGAHRAPLLGRETELPALLAQL